MTSRAFDIRQPSSPAVLYVPRHAGKARRTCPVCLETPVLDVLRLDTPARTPRLQVRDAPLPTPRQPWARNPTPARPILVHFTHTSPCRAGAECMVVTTCTLLCSG